MAEEATIDVNASTESAAPVADTQPSAPSDSSPDEISKDEVVNDDQMQDTDEPQGDTEGTEDVQDADSQEQRVAKNSAQNRIRTLANENRELKRKLESKLSEEYQPVTPEDLVEQGYDETTAQVEALRQQMEIDKFSASVTRLNTDLNTDAVQVIAEYPVFDPASSEYDEKFADTVQNMYRQASELQFDKSGEYVVSAKVPLYDFYKQMAEIRGSQRSSGQIEGQKNAERMLASVDAPSSAAPTTPKGDETLAEMRERLSAVRF